LTVDQQDLIPLIRLEHCPLDEGVFLEVAGRELAVFRLSKPPGVYVIENSCPHASGNLSAGQVQDGVVTCPWHGWKFRVCDGRSTQGSVARVESYPVEIKDGVVHVRL
jgi:nitrite reductase (NADH) small subunit